LHRLSLFYWQIQSGKLLSLAHVRTLKMTDEVLSVKYSPNGKLLAVSLLDFTVKVFYQDSLKFFLSLYGHKVSVGGVYCAYWLNSNPAIYFSYLFSRWTSPVIQSLLLHVPQTRTWRFGGLISGIVTSPYSPITKVSCR
jgi:WD40 repeat protein